MSDERAGRIVSDSGSKSGAWSLQAVTPEQAKKGGRMLGRLNDWLVDTSVGYVMPREVAEWLGGLMVECNRIVREAEHEPDA
jgi:hypothetical protein